MGSVPRICFWLSLPGGRAENKGSMVRGGPRARPLLPWASSRVPEPYTGPPSSCVPRTRWAGRGRPSPLMVDPSPEGVGVALTGQSVPQVPARSGFQLICPGRGGGEKGGGSSKAHGVL